MRNFKSRIANSAVQKDKRQQSEFHEAKMFKALKTKDFRKGPFILFVKNGYGIVFVSSSRFIQDICRSMYSRYFYYSVFQFNLQRLYLILLRVR